VKFGGGACVTVEVVVSVTVEVLPVVAVLVTVTVLKTVTNTVSKTTKDVRHGKRTGIAGHEARVSTSNLNGSNGTERGDAHRRRGSDKRWCNSSGSSASRWADGSTNGQASGRGDGGTTDWADRDSSRRGHTDLRAEHSGLRSGEALKGGKDQEFELHVCVLKMSR